MNRLLYTCVSRNSPRGCLQNFPANSNLGIVCLIMGNHLTSIFRTVWLPGKRNWWPLYWCDENTMSAHLRRVNFPFTKARLDGCRWHHSCRHMIGKMSCEWCYCLPTPVTPSWPFHGLSKNETVKWLRSKCFYPSINSCRCVCDWLYWCSKWTYLSRENDIRWATPTLARWTHVHKQLSVLLKNSSLNIWPFWGVIITPFSF